MPDTDIAQGQADVSVPTLNASPEVPVGATASGGFNEDAVVEKIVARLDGVLDRKLQSVKDKRFSKLDQLGDISPLLAIKDQLMAAGLDEGKFNAVVKDYRIEQLLASQPASPVTGGTVTAPEPANDIKTWTAEVLSDAGIAYDDPEYLELVKKPVASRGDWDRNLTKFVAKRSKQATVPGAASAVASGTGATAANSGGNEAKLDAKYARLSELHRAAPSLATRQEIKALTEEINKLGGHA